MFCFLVYIDIPDYESQRFRASDSVDSVGERLRFLGFCFYGKISAFLSVPMCHRTVTWNGSLAEDVVNARAHVSPEAKLSELYEFTAFSNL